jgi:hypothetical protein
MLRRLIWAGALALLAATPFRSLVCLASDCSRDSTGLIPLIDLGGGSYFGATGGLYPSGSNARPAAHTAAGLAIANSIVPLDTLGLPDSTGKIVLISIGMSNATQEFQAFVPKANADPKKNPRVLVVDCAVGGQAANLIRTPTAAYWDSVAARLRRVRSSPAQVQAAWLKEANASPTGGFPASAETLRANLASIVRIMKLKMPNMRITFITSRIYAGYATSSLNPEPYAYESGFAVKWLIESQIAGVDSLNFDPERGPVEAPWLSWGPYLWADGMNPRSDGLVWPCSYFADDGTHPAAGARNLVADSLLAFLKRDGTASPWFTSTVTGAPSEPTRSAGRITRAYPSPASRILTVDATLPTGATGWIRMYDVSGRLVRKAELPRRPAGVRSITLDVAGLASGVYYLQCRDERTVLSSRAIVIAR